MRRILGQLRELGIVTVADVDEVETSVGTEDHGGFVALTELDAWIGYRSVADADAATEIVDAQPDASDVAIGLAFGALLRIGAPAAPAVRTLREDPRLGSHATVWLVGTLQIEAEDVRVDEVEGQVALLDVIAAVHPDKPVAKAARKALFKLRSVGL